MNSNIFEEITVQLHNKIISDPLKEINYSEWNKDYVFGIINLKVIQIPMTKKVQHFIFTIDCSGSMSQQCQDGKSKMIHITHTLENMINYFIEHQEITVYISIYTFDDNVTTIFEKILINSENLDILIRKINLFRPFGQTNIEAALLNVDQKIKYFLNEDQNIEISHILMTDGEPTSGEKNYKKLQKYIKKEINTSLIGFGLHHNAYLLTSLTNDYLNANYYFIDMMEKSGLVYAEIINAIIYKLLSNVQIKIENGLIYNWKQNEWSDCYQYQNLIGETNNIIHIASNNIENCKICISGLADGGIDSDLNEYEKTICIKDSYELTDLTRYIYRQKVLQVLYDLRKYEEYKHKNKEYNKNNVYLDSDDDDYENDRENKITIEFLEDLKNIQKTNMSELFKEMKKYIIENDLKDDIFMKNLCDDIYISFRTFDTRYDSMYTYSRQTSQGNQRCYNVSRLPNEENLSSIVDLNSTIFNRNMTRIPYIRRNLYIDNRDDALNDILNVTINETQNETLNNNTVNYNDLFNYKGISDDSIENLNTIISSFNDHNISEDCLNTTYSTPSRLDMMRSFTQEY